MKLLAKSVIAILNLERKPKLYDGRTKIRCCQ